MLPQTCYFISLGWLPPSEGNMPKVGTAGRWQWLLFSKYLNIKKKIKAQMLRHFSALWGCRGLILQTKNLRMLQETKPWVRWVEKGAWIPSLSAPLSSSWTWTNRLTSLGVGLIILMQLDNFSDFHIFRKVYFQVGLFMKWKLFWNESPIFNTCGPLKPERNTSLSFNTAFEAFPENQDVPRTVFKPLKLKSTNSTFSYSI